MRKMRGLFVAFLVVALMLLGVIAYIGALNIKIKTYHTSQPESESEVQDEERLPSVWDDPEYWKNPWVL